MWEAAVLEPVSVVEGEGGGGEGEWGEYHDFGDIISSQGEINRLQLELSKVKVESQHWRTLAEEKVHHTVSHTRRESINLTILHSTYRAHCTLYHIVSPPLRGTQVVVVVLWRLN